MDKLIGNTFLLIAMACKTKTTLTRAELKKIKEENAKRVKRVEKVKGKVEEVKKESKKRGWGHESPKGNQEFSVIN